ncbi:retrovirus-related pol polyprotein from transposon TNT 1-94, partial [Tanacetum coccineum]
MFLLANLWFLNLYLLTKTNPVNLGDPKFPMFYIPLLMNAEGLGHNLFSVGQFCDSNLEVAFCQHTCFIRNLEGVDLSTGSRGNNLYTLYLGDIMASSPICLLSKASKTKSWLWHRRLSHLNFGAINHLTRHGLVRGLPKLKFEKENLCSACAMGKSNKKPHKPKSKDTNQEKLSLLHMNLCGPMRVASVNGKKYIIVIVDDYSRFTWVKFLRSKDEAPDFIIKFLKMIQIGISHEKSVAHSPQQNEAVATACYTQNRSIIRLHHGKTQYELLHDKPPDLSIFHVFGALYYPTNDSENLGKLQLKADIDFDGLTTMAFEHSSPGHVLHEMTLATISSGLIPNPPPLTPFVPPSRTNWDILFQPMFDELLAPPPSVDHPAPEIIDLIAEVVTLVPVVSTGSPFSTRVDKDAPSLSNSQTTPKTQPPIIPNDVEEDNHDIEVAHMGNDLYFGLPIPEIPSDQSSSPVSTRLQLHERALFCYYNAFLTAVEPKTYKYSLTQSCWIKAMQEELNEFERLELDGFMDPDNPNHVYKLKKALYSLKQAPYTWYDMLSSFLISQDFSKASVDPTMFILDTPMVEKSKLDEDKEGKAVDPSHYRGMIGTLLYLTASRPDLQFAICMCARYQARPTEKHLHAVKRIFRLVSWSSKRQKSAAISSTEAEYIALSGCCAQVLWMRSQLTDYGLGFNKIPMYYDNKSAIALSCNNVQHS